MPAKKPADPALTRVTPTTRTGQPVMPKTTTKPKPAETLPATVTKPGSALMDVKERMRALVLQTKKAEAPTNGYISLQGGRMRIGETAMPGDKLNAVIVGYMMDNEWYPNAYVQGQPNFTTCAAIVKPHEVLTPWRKLRPGETPDKLAHWDADLQLGTEASDPQVPAGRACDSCRLLEWGSAAEIVGKTGSGAGKGCRESRRIYVMAADQCTTPGDIERAPYMTMIPPPTSAPNFSTFANEVTTVLDLPIFGAVVEISVKPHPKYQFMAHYKLLEPIRDEGLLLALMLRHESIMAKNVVLPKAGDDKAVADQRGAPAVRGKF